MFKWLAFTLAAVAVVAFASWRLVSGPPSPTVVVYVSHDQVFSEPILKDFEKEIGSESALSMTPRRPKVPGP